MRLNNERYPFAILRNFEIRYSAILKTSLDHLDLRLEYSGKYQLAARQTHEASNHSDNHVSSQICADEVGRSHRFIDRTHTKRNLDVIRLCIFARDSNRCFIRINSFDTSFGKKFRGCDRQNAGAGSDVEEAAAGKVFLDRLQAETRGLVSAGAEGHSGFDPNHQARISVAELRPRWRDYETSDFDGLPVLFPLFEPIALRNFANAHVAD